MQEYGFSLTLILLHKNRIVDSVLIRGIRVREAHILAILCSVIFSGGTLVVSKISKGN